MSMAAIPSRRAVRARISGSDAWRRIGRLTALTVAYVVLITILRATRFDPSWIEPNLFALCYPYVLLAVWLGDLWEALGAVALSAGVTAWIVLAEFSTWPYLPWWSGPRPDQGSWLLYVVTALAIVGLAHRRRGASRGAAASAPVVTTDMTNPVLVIQGHVQVLRGGGVVFDSGTQQDATEQLAPVKGQHTPR